MLVSRASASARRISRRSLGVVAAGLFASTLLLAGCQANPAPPPLTSTSTSPSPTEASADTPPALPDEARGTSRAAAKAFVHHYVRLTNHAIATGDTDALAAASDSECTSCSAVISKIEAVYSAGGSIRSRGWEVRSIRPVAGSPRSEPRFDLGIEMAPQEVIEREGSNAKRYDGGKLPATFTLARNAGNWNVLQWERTA